MQNKAIFTTLILSVLSISGCSCGFHPDPGKDVSKLVAEKEVTTYAQGSKITLTDLKAKLTFTDQTTDVIPYASFANNGIAVKLFNTQNNEIGLDAILDTLGSYTLTTFMSSDTTKSSNISINVVKQRTEEDVQKYMDNLAAKSAADHLYVHYYRFDQKVASYNQWDIWAWPYRDKEGEGYRFDWNGRTTSADRKSASGDAILDELGYATVDIDLTKEYDGGWDAGAKKMGGTPTNFKNKEGDDLDEQVGVQIVKSDTRESGSGFWVNDGSNLYVTLDNFVLLNKDGATYSYHVFATQDSVQNATARPSTAAPVDPFIDDDGTNVTYGKGEYVTADWKDKPLKDTSKDFLENVGVGYQVMVSSFADSDGDGFGDIYGIEQKLDYIEDLGIKALWLTPIQLSDSYHGYDISDYMKVDPKFGSTTSPAGIANLGVKTSETAAADYKSLIDACHERGIKVVMDLVLNHTSTSNKWFVNSAQLDKTLRAYYQWGNHETQSEHIKEANFWYPYGSHVYSYYAKFGSSMPELNYSFAKTREAVETVALNWCEIGVDGFRMDAVKHIFMTDEVEVDPTHETIIEDISKTGNYSSDLTKNLNFWRELNYKVKSSYPNAFFVGENFDGHAFHVAPYYEGFDSLFDFYSYYNFTTLAACARTNRHESGTVTSAFLGANPKVDPFPGDGKSLKYDGNWDLKSIFSTYNKYRTAGLPGNASSGYAMINGAFTSNHDISRSINRVAGTVFDNTGLIEQGDVSTSNYSTYDNLATLVQIAQIMLPGCTWIYYGDEIGMTGNFEGKKATDSYADLKYRQPMKWSDNITDEGICNYAISGSGANVGWDNVNKTNSVVNATTQSMSDNSHYGVISKFASAKESSQALINGYFEPQQSSDWLVKFDRVLGGERYRVFVNFGNNAEQTGCTGEVVATYNGATQGNVPAHSALVLKTDGKPAENKYQIKVGGDVYDTTKNPTPIDPSFEEFYALGIAAEAGDEMTAINTTTGAEWTIQNLDGASTGWKLQNKKIVCTQTGVYDFYLKFKYENDQVYIGLHK